MDSADVIEVGLPSLPQAEAELLVCDLRLVLAEALKKTLQLLHQSPYLPTWRTEANEGEFLAEEPSHAPRIIRFLA